jgi:hypothetical protein
MTMPMSSSGLTNSIDRAAFENFYAGPAPWDIGKPQPAFTAFADPWRPRFRARRVNTTNYSEEPGSGPAWPGRSPAWVGGLNVPGYHRHFLSDDRTVGGYVLGCRVREGRVQYEVCRDWLIKLDGRRSDRRPPSNKEKPKS